MKKLKQMLLMSILTLISTALHAQWTPCTPCNPNPCLSGELTNNTGCEIIFEVLFPGNPQCSSNIILRIPIGVQKMKYSITCHKCIDGPCSCPIGLKLLDPADQTTPLGIVNFTNYVPPATFINNYSTTAGGCGPSFNVQYNLLSSSVINITIM